MRKKRFLAWVIVLTMLLTLIIPAFAWAVGDEDGIAENGDTGDVVVEGGNAQDGDDGNGFPEEEIVQNKNDEKQDGEAKDSGLRSVNYIVYIAEGIENGTVTADPEVAPEGTPITLTVQPDAGYMLSTLTYTPDGGEAVPVYGNQFDMPDSNVTVAATFDPAVATVGGVGYAYLEDALLSVPPAGTATIVLCGDVSETMYVSDSKAITLDLGGNTLTGQIIVESGASLTLRNGTIANAYATEVDTIVNSGTLVLNGATIQNNAFSDAVYAINNAAGTATINSGAVQRTDNSGDMTYAIGACGGTVRVNGGTISGDVGVRVAGGTFEVRYSESGNVTCYPENGVTVICTVDFYGMVDDQAVLITSEEVVSGLAVVVPAAASEWLTDPDDYWSTTNVPPYQAFDPETPIFEDTALYAIQVNGGGSGSGNDPQGDPEMIITSNTPAQLTVTIEAGYFTSDAAQPVIIAGDAGTVTFNTIAVQNLASSNHENDLTLQVVYDEACSTDALIIYRILLLLNNAPIFTEPVEGAYATVTLPIDTSRFPNGTRMKIEHKSEDGPLLETLFATVTDGTVTVQLPHFCSLEISADDSPVYSESYTWSLELLDDICMNYYLRNLEAAAAYVVEYSFNGASQTVSVPQGSTSYTLERIVHFAAPQMKDTVSIKVYRDGTLIKDTDTYSVYAYCHIKLDDESTSDEMKDLCRAILNYGGYAQIHFNYKTDDLAYEGLNAPLIDAVPQDVYVYQEDGNCAGVERTRMSLELESKFVLNFYFTPAEGYTADNLTIALDGTTITNETTGLVTRTDLDDGRVNLKITGIKARELGTQYVIGVSDEASDMTITYSPLSYLCKTQASEVSRAAYAYYQAAVTYFPLQNP